MSRAIPDVVSHQIGDDCRIPWIVLGDPGLDFAYQISSNICSLGVDSSSELSKHRHKTRTEAAALFADPQTTEVEAHQRERSAVRGRLSGRQAGKGRAMNFDACLAFVLRWEGGFVDDPEDDGGRTNRGVTQNTYNEWRERKGYDLRNVKDIEPGEVWQIYNEQYWNATRCKAMPAPFCLALFDAAVQHGINRPIKWLQEVIGTEQDGHFGPVSMRMLDEYVRANGQTGLIERFLERRMKFYKAVVQHDPVDAKFWDGWMNRMKALRKELGLCAA